MSGSAADTARPSGAAIAWATKDGIFVEIPSKNGNPYIVRYRKTAEGLALALNVLIEHEETVHRTISQSHPAINRVKPEATAKSRAPWANDADRARVQGILKRLKITA